MRPWFWIPALAAAITGYLLATPQADFAEITLVLVAAGALSAASEGMNDVSDYDMDQGTPGSMVGTLRLSGGSGAIGNGLSMSMAWFVIMLCSLVGLAAAAALSAASLIAGAIALLLSTAYSLPPLRLKRWGIAGIAAHAVGYGPLAMSLGAGFSIIRPEIAIWAVVVGLWVATVGLTADVLDIETDEKAGVRTVPVLLGRRVAVFSIIAGSLVLAGLATAYIGWHGATKIWFLAVFWVVYAAWLANLLRFNASPLPPEMHLGTLLLEAIFPLLVLF
jgi:4-hydroxybenzoate polyprenyltransferase